MKKTALVTSFAIALLIITVADKEPFSLTKANPFSWIPPYYETEWTDSPFIYLDSPRNKTYAENVSMSFTVFKPETWLSDPLANSQLVSQLLTVEYYIDGKFQGSIIANSDLSSPFHYSVSLTDLKEGSHILMVKTNSIGVKADWDDREWVYTRVYAVPADSASVIRPFNFVEESSANPFQTVSIISAVIVAIALTGTASLIYFKKRQRKRL